MKGRLCSYDMVEVPHQAFVLTDPGYGNDLVQNGPLALSGVEGPQDAWVFRRF